MNSVAIIIPALNEAQNIVSSLAEILRHTEKITDIEFVLIVVDDGSSDETAELVRERGQSSDDNIRLLCLNRHFGKEAAIYAGIVNAVRFDAAIVMDSDLQHPPQLIGEMISNWQQGYQVVEGVKDSRGGESRSKNLLVRMYYRLFSFFTKLSINGDTDFKLLDKAVIQAYNDLPEHGRFFRGLVKWMNFPTKQISFDVPASVRSSSSWESGSLFRYAISSIASFTAFPLQIVTFLGGVTFLISIVLGGIALFDKLSGEAVTGFTTVILLILLIGSILMTSVGLIGIYVGKIYDEVKRRPNYLVNRAKSNLDGL